jgi:hypothetical protein
MSDSITLSSVAINCPNAGGLAAFYADITGGQVTFVDPTWATINGPGGRIDFQTVPGYTPPTWPDHRASRRSRTAGAPAASNSSRPALLPPR